jgi:hypothetical protein
VDVKVYESWKDGEAIQVDHLIGAGIRSAAFEDLGDAAFFNQKASASQNAAGHNQTRIAK